MPKTPDTPDYAAKLRASILNAAITGKLTGGTDGWKTVKGKTLFEETETKRPQGKYFDYIDIDAIDNKRFKIIKPKRLRVAEAPSRASRGIKEGDVLFSIVRPYLRNIALVEKEFKDCIASTGFFVCRSRLCEPKYLFWLMLSPYVIDGLMAHMKGDNSPSIRKNDILKFDFPLPPLGVQKEIVAKVEELMALVDIVREGAAKIRDLGAKARAKILDLAIRGKLVAQDPNEQPPAVASAPDTPPYPLPKNWKWVKLGEIGKFQGGHTPSKLDKTLWGGNILWVSSKDMKTKYIEDTGDKITEKGAKELGLLPPRTILMCTRSGILRRTFPVAIARKPLTINQDQKALILMKPEMAEWVYLVLKGLEPYILLNYRKSGTTVESIIWNEFINMPIPLPPLGEQKRIVAKVESLLAAINDLR